MGVTISATHSSYDFDMGYGGFFNLRKNIAYALNKHFGKAYEGYIHCHTKEERDENDRLCEMYIEAQGLEKEYEDVLDFLYASDTDGTINYKTCKKIADLLEPCMPTLKTKIFRYVKYTHNDYEEFVTFLKECYRYHRNMCWY